MFSADIRILIRPVIETALKLYCTRTDALSDPDKVFHLLDNDSLVKLKEKFESEPKIFDKFKRDLIRMSKCG